MTIIRKTHIDESQGDVFTLSDETPDRYNDVISATGWDLRNFEKNPVALFQHQSSFPIGVWTDIQVKDGALRGRLQMAPKGTSDRIDEIRALIAAGILRATSVGFRPIESKPRSNSGPGEHYTKVELMECSIVSVPANPNALMVAKQLGISKMTQKMVFARNRSERIKKKYTLEQRREIQRKAEVIVRREIQSKTEAILKRKERTTKFMASQTPEQRRQIIRKAKALLARLEANPPSAWPPSPWSTTWRGKKT
jgi:HK97 family phage prohead protease